MLASNIDRPGYGLQDYMAQAKNTIRFLKYLGVGLVALPEPFTTPFGVALLFTANYLSHKLESGLDIRLPEASAYYSYWFKHPEDYDDSTSSDPLKSHARSGQRPAPWLYADCHSLKAEPDPAVRQARRQRRDRERLTAPPIGEPISLPVRERCY